MLSRVRVYPLYNILHYPIREEQPEQGKRVAIINTKRQIRRAGEVEVVNTKRVEGG